MPWFEKKKPKPVPFHPWQSPPLGSAGNEWDAHIEFPPLPGEREARVRLVPDQAKKAEARPDSDPWEWVPPVNRFAVVAVTLALASVISSGPLLYLRIICGGAAVLAGMGTLLLLKHVDVLDRGRAHAIGAIIVGGIFASEAIAWNHGLRIPGLGFIH